MYRPIKKLHNQIKEKSVKSKNFVVVALLAILALAAVYFIYQKLNPKTLPENLLQGTGKIDGDLIRLNTKYPGRIEEINAVKGAAIKKGELIARLKSEEIEARLEQASARHGAISNELNAAEKEFEILKSTLPRRVEKAKKALNIARAQVLELTKRIESLTLVTAQDKKDYRRLKALFEKQLLEKQKVEQAKLKYENDLKKLDALKQKQTQARNHVEISHLDTQDAQQNLQTIDATQEKLKAQQEQLKAASAAIKEIRAMIDELSLVSAVNGFVVDRTANIGEVIGAGTAVASLIDPETLYLKIFIDTMQNGKIKISDPAVIFLDAYPNRPFKAKVVRIAQKAEFTPKEVSVRSDRIQRVFAVELKPLSPDPLLKLGIPAIGIISLDGKGLPQSLENIPLL